MLYGKFKILNMNLIIEQIENLTIFIKFFKKSDFYHILK